MTAVTPRPPCLQMTYRTPRSNVRHATLTSPVLLRAFRDPRASNERGPKKTRWRAHALNGSNTESAEQPLVSSGCSLGGGSDLRGVHYSLMRACSVRCRPLGSKAKVVAEESADDIVGNDKSRSSGGCRIVLRRSIRATRIAIAATPVCSAILRYDNPCTSRSTKVSR